MRTRSPFPGMDPWLERYWGSVHHRMINFFADQIQEQLPDGLFAEVEVTVYIADEEGDRGVVIPDVGVLESGWSESLKDVGNIAVATPYRVQLRQEPVEEGHVVIRSLADNKPLITVIEVLSPTNKVDRRGRAAYVLKRESYYHAHANLVEIDLLRAGAELVDVPFEELPDRLLTPYKAVVRRSYPMKNTEAEYYALPLQERLSRIPIPLRRKDADVVLDIQASVDSAYKKGRFASRIDYSKPPVPALSPEDTAWAAELVAASV